MPDNVEIEVRNRIAVARMNRPARRNALSVEYMRELIATAHDLAERRDVDAVVLTGGERFFSAGADLKDPDRWNLEERPLIEQREMMATGYRLCRAWEELPQMVVAAIEGYAIGGAGGGQGADHGGFLRVSDPGDGPGRTRVLYRTLRKRGGDPDTGGGDG
jgi:enoyl-CoA hydratase/carnithine racemase